jgi:hypothetical protein
MSQSALWSKRSNPFFDNLFWKCGVALCERNNFGSRFFVFHDDAIDLRNKKRVLCSLNAFNFIIHLDCSRLQNAKVNAASSAFLHRLLSALVLHAEIYFSARNAWVACFRYHVTEFKFVADAHIEFIKLI